jgi:wyosine [tRNA(Phe)-imidazoG37] synthetase (radical SAM superfamily)
MSSVFGPVSSRRLGQSLGIDPIPLKTCNWNCVYCQLGRTSPLAKHRSEYIPCSLVLLIEQDLLYTIASKAPNQVQETLKK